MVCSFRAIVSIVSRSQVAQLIPNSTRFRSLTKLTRKFGFLAVTHPRDIYSINLTRLKSYLPDTYPIQNSRLTTLPPRILRNQAHGTNLTERSLITQFPTKRSFRFIRHADVNRIPRIITYLLCCILSFPRWIPDFNLPLQRTHPLLRSTIYLGRDL